MTFLTQMQNISLAYQKDNLFIIVMLLIINELCVLMILPWGKRIKKIVLANYFTSSS